ncbi:hypothetical protein NQ176_g7527 [Zarea fungicola]|uniref:Uncharacterized protein n=1 Tax=Zarea fungicola TaxID=93591 RepID=A0ACC1MY86_9HYPO|nr:hypothetical protein NQ176_g7527 [Lecanicillium fungicola]
MHPDHIIHSDNLYDYFSDNHGANHTIYVNNTRAFIDMSQVKPQLGKRQYANPCFGYVSNWAEQVQHWWGEWHPASGCLYTGNDKAGGSYNMAWSYSLSIADNTGVSWSIIEKVLTMSSQITVTQIWSHSGSITCNVPGNSVGQVWIQNALVWGWMWSEGCQSCGYGGGCGLPFGYKARADGGALAPVASTNGGQGANYGCSAGASKVKC